MPGKFVFPGGSTDFLDGSVASVGELSPEDTQKLLLGMGARATLRRARSLGLCAIRETFEETGLRVAMPAANTPSIASSRYHSIHSDWQAFLEAGHAPALGCLRYFARAITPPGNIRRFDARFFIAFCDSLPQFDPQQIQSGEQIAGGELENLDWVFLEDVAKLDTARITRTILKDAQNLLAETRLDLPATLPVVQYSMRHGRYARDVI
ncbi:NUDIX hydrolase [Brucella sp. BE17]|uniref:NUDIX hydrolase n=1 Tax=Brucella sp. BE17 TaxID=3142977 RepID=UPI0031BA2255